MQLKKRNLQKPSSPGLLKKKVESGKSRIKLKLILADFVKGKRIVNFEWNRKVYPITPSVAGTARRFRDSESMKHYLALQNALNSSIRRQNPKLFSISFPQILYTNWDYNAILERVHPSPDIQTILQSGKLRQVKEHRYTPFYLRMLKRKELNQNEAKKIITAAFRELEEKLKKTNLYTDLQDSNVLVKDIDKKTKKVSFILVDFGFSIPE